MQERGYFYLLIYLLAVLSLCAAWGLSLAVAVGGYSELCCSIARAMRFLLLRLRGSEAVAQ